MTALAPWTTKKLANMVRPAKRKRLMLHYYPSREPLTNRSGHNSPSTGRFFCHVRTVRSLGGRGDAAGDVRAGAGPRAAASVVERGPDGPRTGCLLYTSPSPRD